MQKSQFITKPRKISTLVVVRPTGLTSLDGLKKISAGNLSIEVLDHQASNENVFELIKQTADNLQATSPTPPLDLIVVAIGGTGSGKGATLLGMNGSIGVAQLLFQNRRSLASKQDPAINVFELKPASDGTTVKDLVVKSSTSRAVPRSKSDQRPITS